MTNEEILASITLEHEEWKQIRNYENYYAVSNCGRVLSLGRYRKARDGGKTWVSPRILKEKTTRLGYKQVVLFRDNTLKYYSIHRLVALAFIPNPFDLPQIDHIDGNKANNNVNNLRWCTAKENMQNPITKQVVKNTHFGHAPIPVVSLNGNTIVKKYSSATDATKDGFKRASICSVCAGRRKTHYGLKWMYLCDYENLVNQNVKELFPN
jgi:hypothetical protein